MERGTTGAMESGAQVTNALMQGPRGRRVLLSYALAHQRSEGTALWRAVFDAAYHLDPGAGRSRVVFTDGDGRSETLSDSAIPRVAPAEVARLLENVTLAPVTDHLLTACIGEAVDSARYWQEPDGEDVLLAAPELQPALSRIARHLAASPLTRWWRSPVDRPAQWAISWDDDQPISVGVDPRAALHQSRDRMMAGERTAAAEWPTDLDRAVSADWWSTPSAMISSTRALADAAPVGLAWVEDGLGWESAHTRRLDSAAAHPVFEIDSAEAWAELCERFPLEQTARKRGDWYRTTGRNGRWIMPDWAAVAEHYAGVHLQVATYLAAAGTAIAVDEEFASVIAGWNPDQTYWFSPHITYAGQAVSWEMDEAENRWRVALT